MTRAALLRDFAGFLVAVFAVGVIVATDPAPVEPPALSVLAVAAIALWVAWQDLADYTIPDGAVAGLALIGATLRLVAGQSLGLPTGTSLGLIVFDAAFAGGGLLMVRELYFRRRGFDGLGFGDVKLGAAGAVLTGATGFALALLAASLAALGLALARRPAGVPIAAMRIAFGAALGPAIALVFAAGAAGLLPGPLD